MGELQKRINDRFKTGKLLPPMIWPEDNKNHGLEWGDVLIKSEVEKWVEEMQKEFPYRKLEGGMDIQTELLKLARDRHYWFVKWLK